MDENHVELLNTEKINYWIEQKNHFNYFIANKKSSTKTLEKDPCEYECAYALNLLYFDVDEERKLENLC